MDWGVSSLTEHFPCKALDSISSTAKEVNKQLFFIKYPASDISLQ